VIRPLLGISVKAWRNRPTSWNRAQLRLNEAVVFASYVVTISSAYALFILPCAGTRPIRA